MVSYTEERKRGKEMTLEQQNAETVVAMGKELERLKAELVEQKKETAAGKSLWVDAQKRCKARYLQCEQLQAELEVVNAENKKWMDKMKERNSWYDKCIDAYKKCNKLEDKITSLEDIIVKAKKCVKSTQEDNTELQSENKEMRDYILDEARHSAGCSREFDEKYRCRCGLADFQKVLEKQKAR